MDPVLDAARPTEADARLRGAQRYPLARLNAIDGRLGRIHAAWQASRCNFGLPSWGDLDRMEIHQLADGVNAVQVLSLHGTDFSFVALTGANDAGTPAAPTREDLRSVASFGSARFDRLDVEDGEGTRAIYRLMLPLARDGVRVNQILVCCNAA